MFISYSPIGVCVMIDPESKFLEKNDLFRYKSTFCCNFDPPLWPFLSLICWNLWNLFDRWRDGSKWVLSYSCYDMSVLNTIGEIVCRVWNPIGDRSFFVEPLSSIVAAYELPKIRWVGSCETLAEISELLAIIVVSATTQLLLFSYWALYSRLYLMLCMADGNGLLFIWRWVPY